MLPLTARHTFPRGFDVAFSELGRFFRLSGTRQFSHELLLSMPPEAAHAATIAALRMGAVPKPARPDPENLGLELAGLGLPNPLGMAAGFDKNAQVGHALCQLGFGFAEVGTVTPLPQAGNAKPRVFRLEGAGAIINRMGFNSAGHEPAMARLDRPRPGATIGVNIGANKNSDDFVADYVQGVRNFAPLADYIALNVSSPNTKGLRDLQSGEALKRLLGEVLAERARAPFRVPVFLKLAPDLDEAGLDEIAAEIGAVDLDGLIISNTTLSRTGVERFKRSAEAGGLSGAPLFNLATRRLAQMRLRVGEKFPIIGVGGIHDGPTALAKLAAGADAIQLYTGLVFGGFELITEIKTAISEAITNAGGTGPGVLVGTETKDWAAGKAEL
ncbi:MAG: quinone-dependent dihydroorotate dehydrogenase [Alphaproteobacteria bacterium]|nr:quinone-dependent dihydroorotate dehydrogenase [Alphaproteobacteria bacterium]